MDIADLRAARDYHALAALFGVSAVLLKRHLYGTRSPYIVFPIPKKSGGVRVIAAPSTLRLKLQQKICPLLDSVYRPTESANAFIKKRNVRRNAVRHVGRRTVINIDLKDFFTSITFQRVRGIFLAQPIALDWFGANALAQLCCHEGVLPTGGATSPVISNILTAKLDKKMSAMIGRLGGSYSRYADDITMSFDRPVAQLSSLIIVDDVGRASVSGALSEVISSEGFTVNDEKTRVSVRGQRQIVAGLVVKEKVNVRRAWYADIESKIYACERFGIQKIAMDAWPDDAVEVSIPRLLRHLHGKISYLSMIRGKGDWLCAELAHRFNSVHSNPRLRVPSVEIVNNPARIKRGVLVVNCAMHDLLMFDRRHSQGTGFVLPSGLVVTAAHVVTDEESNSQFSHVYIMRERDLRLVRCEVVACNLMSDIAILKESENNVDVERHRYSIGYASINLEVNSVGFPNYHHGDEASVHDGVIVRRFSDHGVRKADVSGAIQGGLSGGPVVNRECKVVGVVHKGVSSAAGIGQIVEIDEVLSVVLSAGLRI